MRAAALVGTRVSVTGARQTIFSNAKAPLMSTKKGEKKTRQQMDRTRTVFVRTDGKDRDKFCKD